MQTQVTRIGQVKDQDDFFATQPLLCIYCAVPNSTRITNRPMTPPPSVTPKLTVDSLAISHSAITEGNIPPSAVDATLATPKAKKVPKPANSWILYRKSKHHSVVAQNPGMHTSEICKLARLHIMFHKLTAPATIIGNMWKNEEPSIKTFWKVTAENEKRLHALRNPGYRVTPRKSSAIKRRKTKKVTTVEVSGPLSATVQPEPYFSNNMNYLQPETFDNPSMSYDDGNVLPLDISDQELERFFAGIDSNFDFQFGEMDGQMNDLFSSFGNDSTNI
jgi:hypothetical protein